MGSSTLDIPHSVRLISSGMNILIDGTVPKAAGMSSSSALVCVAGLATAYANDCQVTKVIMKI